MTLSVLIAVRHTSSGTDDRSDDDRTLSASGFPEHIDGSGCITWSWKTQLPSEFITLYEVTPGLLITKSMWPGITVTTEVHGRVLLNCTQTYHWHCKLLSTVTHVAYMHVYFLNTHSNRCKKKTSVL